MSKFAHRFDNELKTPCDAESIIKITYGSIIEELLEEREEKEKKGQR